MQWRLAGLRWTAWSRLVFWIAAKNWRKRFANIYPANTRQP
jgi:hypothetical protein